MTIKQDFASQSFQSWIQFLLLLIAIVAGIITFDRRITVLEVKLTTHMEQEK